MFTSLDLYCFKIQDIDEISVVLDNKYPPYVFFEDNKLKGYLIDLWSLWEKYNGVKVIITGKDWGVAQKEMEAGKYDVIDTIFYNEQRNKIYDFGIPYERLDVPIFVHKEITGITDISSLKGFIVGGKEGDNSIKILNDSGINDIYICSSYEEVIMKAKDEYFKIFTIDYPPAFYYLEKYKISKFYKLAFYLDKGYFHRAVKKGNKDLISFVDRGFTKIPKTEYKKIRNKWFGVSINSEEYRKKALLYTSVSIVLFTLLLFIILVLNFIIRMKTKYLLEEIENRKRIEEKLKQINQENEAILKTIPDILFEIDEEGYYKNYYSRSQNLLINDWDNLKNKNVKAFLPKEITDKLFNAFSKISSVNDIEGFSYSININNELKYFDCSIVLKSKNEENKRSFLVLIKNVSDFIKLYNALIENERFVTVGGLAAGMAHEINNPLSGILQSIQNIFRRIDINNVENQKVANELGLDLSKLHDYFDKRGVNRYLEGMRSGAVRAGDIIRSMLKFGKKMNIELNFCSLNEIVRNSVKIMQNDSEETVYSDINKRIKIELNLCEDLKDIYANSAQIEQVLVNVFKNSFQAVKTKNEGFIRVRTYFDDDYSVVDIEDNGCGISEEIKKRIFEPFFSTKDRGTGLGLSITHSIINAHGGRIEVSSKKEEGTEFAIYLPIEE